jgi:PEP-CTERM motif
MKICVSIRFALAVFAAATAIPCHANVALNGSFESPGLTFRSFCITFFTPACPAILSWSGNFYLVNDDSGGGIGGVPTPPIPDGAQYIMIQTTGNADQSITLTQAGTYNLSWFDAGRTFFSNVESYSVIFGGNTLGFFTTTTTSPWTQHTIQFSGSPGTFTLSFLGTNLSGGDNSFFLDNVQLDGPPPVTGAAPEPSTLALAAAALVAVAVKMRKAASSSAFIATR